MINIDTVNGVLELEELEKISQDYTAAKLQKPSGYSETNGEQNGETSIDNSQVDNTLKIFL